jgi:hypothetical protein
MKASFFLLLSVLLLFFVLIQADADVQDETVKNTQANHLDDETETDEEHQNQSQYHDTDYANAHTESQLHDAEF